MLWGDCFIRSELDEDTNSCHGRVVVMWVLQILLAAQQVLKRYRCVCKESHQLLSSGIDQIYPIQPPQKDAASCRVCGFLGKFQNAFCSFCKMDETLFGTHLLLVRATAGKLWLQSWYVLRRLFYFWFRLRHSCSGPFLLHLRVHPIQSFPSSIQTLVKNLAQALMAVLPALLGSLHFMAWCLGHPSRIARSQFKIIK